MHTSAGLPEDEVASEGRTEGTSTSAGQTPKAGWTEDTRTADGQSPRAGWMADTSTSAGQRCGFPLLQKLILKCWEALLDARHAKDTKNLGVRSEAGDQECCSGLMSHSGPRVGAVVDCLVPTSLSNTEKPQWATRGRQSHPRKDWKLGQTSVNPSITLQYECARLHMAAGMTTCFRQIHTPGTTQKPQWADRECQFHPRNDWRLNKTSVKPSNTLQYDSKDVASATFLRARAYGCGNDNVRACDALHMHA